MAETTHACPSGLFGVGVTPCCGKTVFELPHDDRIASDPGLVTCTGGDR